MRISDWSSDVCSSDLVEANSFFGPLKVLATRGVAFAGIVEEGRQAVARVVAPALMNYALFLEKVLLPVARDAVDCVGDIGGEGHYRFLIRQYTTIDLPPEQIHAIGLAEVERKNGKASCREKVCPYV